MGRMALMGMVPMVNIMAVNIMAGSTMVRIMGRQMVMLSRAPLSHIALMAQMARVIRVQLRAILSTTKPLL
jgi:hypothetical protein